MAGGREAVTFDEIIQAGRARSRNEQLAKEIFGRNRKNKECNGRSNRSSSRTPSLASRVGVQKSQRLSSSSSATGTQRPIPRSRTPLSAQTARTSRMKTALESRMQAALDSASSSQAKVSQSRGISIKGAAGPFSVVATNFAPGTTAADIESAVAHDGTDADGNNTLLSCHLTSTRRDGPVTAELVYSDRAVAEKIVSLYDNQRADGRILKLCIKSSSGRGWLKTGPQDPQPQAATGAAAAAAAAAGGQDQDEEDVDMLSPDAAPAPDRYNSSRESEAAARARCKEQHRRREPDSREERYAAAAEAEAAARANGGNAARREDEAEAEPNNGSRSRNHDGERERRDDQLDRRYDDRRERDGDYDRSEAYSQDRGRRAYDHGPAKWDAPRGARASHYGNNVGGPVSPAPRGSYGGYGGPGRGGGGGMYAGPRGPRGGYSRGGYGGRGW